MNVATIALTALLGVSALPLSTAAQEASPRPPKIHGLIEHHRLLKVRPPGMAASVHRANLLAEGLRPGLLDAEECAVYVQERLSEEEIASLEFAGLRFHPTIWVPPVPGRHSHGFHVVEVPYERLSLLEADSRVQRVDSVEFASEAQNDLAAAMINLDDVKASLASAGIAQAGTGVRIAVADSGANLAHPDLPGTVEAWDMTDGVSPASWGANVGNLITNHGTHVSGTAVGSGLLSGNQYQGAAPGAQWCFYKIGNDVNSTANFVDQIEAVQRAQVMNCDIFSMSYGGVNTTQMDGSSPLSQAIDAASQAGMACFLSAGNEQDDLDHASVQVAPGTNSPVFTLNVADNTGPLVAAPALVITVMWIDNGVFDQNVTLACTNLAPGENLVAAAVNMTNRGTEEAVYQLNHTLAGGANRNYNFRLTNGAAGGGTPLVHTYSLEPTGLITAFAAPDATFTVTHPAISDTAIAVGAYTHRQNWTDSQGNGWALAGAATVLQTLAPFSSQGPRIDGVMKPDICAPGQTTISCLDMNPGGLTNAPAAWAVIDNNGSNDGVGPANYAVSSGTSMAAPLAAGSAAALLQAMPNLTPAALLQILQSTASLANNPNTNEGFGLIDIEAAYALAADGGQADIWVDFAYNGPEFGTFTLPFDTLAEAVAAASSGSVIAIKGGSTAEAPTITKALTLRSWLASTTIGD